MLQPPEPPPGYRTGSLTVEPDNLPTRIAVLSFDPGHVSEQSIADVDELARLMKREPDRTHWVHAQGLGSQELLRALAGVFSLDEPMFQDLTESSERPKVEWLADRVLAVLRAPYVTPRQKLDLDHIGLLIGSNYVLSIQENHSSLLQPDWDRIVQGYAGTRDGGAAHLASAIVDRIVDSFYPVLEDMGDRLEDLEDRVMEPGADAILGEVNQVRGELVRLRRILWPQREAVQRLSRNEAKVLPASVEASLRDSYEHSLHISEIVEAQRDLVGAINGTYLAAVSNRTNEVMRVLTIMASVFIPLTFIAGIYGMNFEYIPELKYRYGYFVAWAVMIAVAGAMLGYFHRKGWIQLWGGEKAGRDTES